MILVCREQHLWRWLILIFLPSIFFSRWLKTLLGYINENTIRLCSWSWRPVTEHRVTIFDKFLSPEQVQLQYRVMASGQLCALKTNIPILFCNNYILTTLQLNHTVYFHNNHLYWIIHFITTFSSIKLHFERCRPELLHQHHVLHRHHSSFPATHSSLALTTSLVNWQIRTWIGSCCGNSAIQC